MEVLLIYLVSGAVFGGACAILAGAKNRDPMGWFVLGFLFSLIALIVIAGMPPVAQTKSRRKKSEDADLREFADVVEVAGRPVILTAASGKDGHDKYLGFPKNPTDPERPWLG